METHTDTNERTIAFTPCFSIKS